MRNKFADVFYDLGSKDSKLAIVVADISPAGSIARFRTEFPDRFINTGVAEQIMIGLCAGMALRGMRPVAYTIATFTLFRPFEFIRDDLCYQNLPVTIVGIGGGVTYSTLGSTHHAMEDVAIASALPNMQVIAPCDPAEVEAATHWCVTQTNGPVYLRLGKAGEPDLTSQAVDPWEFGKLRTIRRGSDVAIIGYGPILNTALEIAERFAEQGKSTSLLSAHTLKPLDRQGVANVLNAHEQVIILEEAVPSGSLGEQVKGVAWECGARCRLDCFSLKDEYIHVYGDHEAVKAAHGLDLESILGSLG